jgi:hypothetical protein
MEGHKRRQKLTVSRLLAEHDNKDFIASLTQDAGLLDAEGLAVVILDKAECISVYYRGLELLEALGALEIAIQELIREGFEDD